MATTTTRRRACRLCKAYSCDGTSCSSAADASTAASSGDAAVGSPPASRAAAKAAGADAGAGAEADGVWVNAAFADKLSVFLVLYFVVMIAGRTYEQGEVALFDIAWSCNVALLGASAALRFRSRRWLSAVIGQIGFAHFGWQVDLLCFLTLGFHATGQSAYMFKDKVTPFLLMTTMHHAWFVPSLCYAMRGSGGIDFRAFPLGAACFSLLAVVSGVFPLEYDGVYLNLNMSHEFWPDVKIPIIRAIFDGRSWPVHLVLMAFCSSVANFFGFAMFRLGEVALGWNKPIAASPAAAGKRE